MLYELTGLTVKKFVIIMACEDGECEVYIERDKTKYIKEWIHCNMQKSKGWNSISKQNAKQNTPVNIIITAIMCITSLAIFLFLPAHS